MARVLKGYGGFPRAKAGKKAKTSTKPVFKLTCSKCKHSMLKNYGRTKKVSQV